MQRSPTMPRLCMSTCPLVVIAGVVQEDSWDGTARSRADGLPSGVEAGLALGEELRSANLDCSSRRSLAVGQGSVQIRKGVKGNRGRLQHGAPFHHGGGSHADKQDPHTAWVHAAVRQAHHAACVRVKHVVVVDVTRDPVHECSCLSLAHFLNKAKADGLQENIFGFQRTTFSNPRVLIWVVLPPGCVLST